MKIQWMTALVVMVAFAGNAQAGVFTSGNVDVYPSSITSGTGGFDIATDLQTTEISGSAGTVYSNAWSSTVGPPGPGLGTEVRVLGYSEISSGHQTVGGAGNFVFGNTEVGNVPFPNRAIVVFALADPIIPPQGGAAMTARFNQGVLAVFDIGADTLTAGDVAPNQTDPGSWLKDINDLNDSSNGLLSVFAIRPGSHSVESGAPNGAGVTAAAEQVNTSNLLWPATSGDIDGKTLWDYLESASPTDFFDYGSTPNPGLYIESDGSRNHGIGPNDVDTTDADTLFENLFLLGGLGSEKFLGPGAGGLFKPGAEFGDEASVFSFFAYPGGTVVPEPSSIFAWLILGAAGAIAYRRRRKS